MSIEKLNFYEQSGVAMTCRTFEEYVSMFALKPHLYQGERVLDVAGGASSFTAEACSRGILAEAVDPMYIKSVEQIQEHGVQEIKVSTAKLRDLQHLYNWEYYGDIAQHQAGREKSLKLFLDDYAREDAALRYHRGRLPELPFEEGMFALVLCSHFLFLYEEQFDFAFHLEAVGELLRICKSGGEVLIYPLLNFRTEQYSRLDELLETLQQDGNLVELVTTELPFLPNSKYFMKIRKPE
ncbi:class I SAM-dependent methyltransferase [Paenibacillus eucommiae]|uniref:Ubiquinone/menaquinone biosynthesis C-methylase UbiE n=1 Tax=Paenibacillus eucommiae TaxID=1355755 RepID=A0ABS4IRS7_9BACL|nr:class I SAM-dependent methyltransferase [Paenibacillus eucommiae]MBP1989279.1 ubiquinone/menaquinone biosynthesis C-methylase UbiE [Paenibacillus eucommiae]